MAKADTEPDVKAEANGSKGTKVPRMGMNELGRTGLKEYHGLLYEEFLPSLQGDKAVKVFTEMRANDPVIGALLFAVEMLLREVEWTVEPASDSAADTEAAEFLESCMGDMSHTWADFIAECLTMLPYGWSFFEVVYKQRIGPTEKNPRKRSLHDDGRIGWRKFAPRSQDTMARWEFDEDGGIQALVQRPPPLYEEIEIPITKSLLFRTTSAKNSPEGRSILRNAYRPWLFKKRLEEIESIGAERDLAGLPIAYVPPEILAENRSADAQAAYDALKSIVQKVKRDEQEGILFPLAYDAEGREMYRFELMSSGGRRQFDLNAVIERYSRQMVMVALADFIMLGHESVGSFALSSDKTNLFGVALAAWLDSIAETIQRHEVPRLFQVNNFTGITEYPTLRHGDVEKPDLSTLGTFLQQMTGAGMPLFPDEGMEQHIRELADLPDRPDDLDETILDSKTKEMEAMAGPQQPAETEDGAGPALQQFRGRRSAFDQMQGFGRGGADRGEREKKVQKVLDTYRAKTARLESVPVTKEAVTAELVAQFLESHDGDDVVFGAEVDSATGELRLVTKKVDRKTKDELEEVLDGSRMEDEAAPDPEVAVDEAAAPVVEAGDGAEMDSEVPDDTEALTDVPSQLMEARQAELSERDPGQEYIEQLQEELAASRGQGDLATQVQAMLTELQSQELDHRGQEYRTAIGEAVHELRELLEELQGLEPEEGPPEEPS